ncbi:hypothetical protein SUGI_0717510 [Cryptomeria japonica]|nr:hypothetical protein SUGI_0717510 [Cryptomeria japonica]
MQSNSSINLIVGMINKSQNSRQLKENDEDEDEDDHVDWPAGLPLRYTFQELKNATNNFSVKLGSGVFVSVYEGVLAESSKIAVKRLDGAGQGKREFRAEVETLGKIDHLILVRLKGFCAETAYRMLVYEHLPNGSLDKWIFSNNMHVHLLDLKTRYRIVLNIARGLTYLREDCREKIIHFDIKPQNQNILLYQNFNGKVSDFEIVSRKRSRELSQDGLLSLLQVKAREGKLIDLVYPGLENEEAGVKEKSIKLLKVGMWCVQDNFTRRPAMSTVVKALEGLIDKFDDVPSSLTESTGASNQ